MKNFLIVGATSAIAVACARQWCKDGTHFFLVGRNAEKLAQVANDLRARGATVQTREQDLADLNSHGDMTSEAFTWLGSVDVALIAHGTLPDQAECERDTAIAIREFTTNGLSVISLLTYLANRMESQGTGSIGVISSVAGDRGRPSNYLYGSAKSAVSIFCGGLRARLSKAGVNLTTIKPGFVDTPMTRDLKLPSALTATPQQVANDITKALNAGKGTLYTRWFWRYIMLIIIHIPDRIFRRMSL
jgi:decaprenylphospho-beta-D-erythro-pentofuranosid-2-ulose 2-reductase